MAARARALWRVTCPIGGRSSVIGRCRGGRYIGVGDERAIQQLKQGDLGHRSLHAARKACRREVRRMPHRHTDSRRHTTLANTQPAVTPPRAASMSGVQRAMYMIDADSRVDCTLLIAAPLSSTSLRPHGVRCGCSASSPPDTARPTSGFVYLGASLTLDPRTRLRSRTRRRPSRASTSAAADPFRP